ncbi:MAG TPA: XRE family transcriptional regulator [Planctomycetota bacterium]|nr:XRE family transcriptional regulator [Planctomycetota bacterium]
MAGEIGRVIKRLREKARLRQSDLSSACGVKQPNLSRIEKGRCEPRRATLERIAEALGTTVEGIEADVNLLASGAWHSRAAGEAAEAPTVTIPVLNLPASGPLEVGTAGLPIVPIEMRVELPAAGAPAFACRIRGDSMASAGRDNFADGDLAALALSQPRGGDFALVQTRDGACLRQIFFEAQGMRLVPLNRSYEERLLPLAEVLRTWKLVQHLRVMA